MLARKVSVQTCDCICFDFVLAGSQSVEQAVSSFHNVEGNCSSDKRMRQQALPDLGSPSLPPGEASDVFESTPVSVCRCCGCAFRSYKEFLEPEDKRLAGIQNKGKYMPAGREGSAPG